MKNFVFVILASVLAAVPGGFAAAEDAEGKYSAFSHGTDSCSEVAKSYDGDTGLSYQYTYWIEGFITAAGLYNDTQKSFSNVVAPSDLDYYVFMHCRENPMDPLAVAANAAAQRILDKAGRR